MATGSLPLLAVWTRTDEDGSVNDKADVKGAGEEDMIVVVLLTFYDC